MSWLGLNFLKARQATLMALYVLRNGQTELASTKAVVLACGSYEGSMKKRIAQMGAEWKKEILHGTEYNTGDGIDMAMAAGAIKTSK